ncbi:hypothetical protein GCM10009811_34970 [Nostocoides veronense]|uniref:Uncharacterized protein n=1 Tax=Nostocoides veronense TaxID=330836 RepID=A0ABN2M5I8_9MICO
MLGGEREVVHHRAAADGDPFDLACAPVLVDDGILHLVAHAEVIGDGVQFAGYRVAMRVRAIGALDGAAEVADSESRQFVVEFGRR